MIAVEHLVKNYGRKEVLRDMSILAQPGEITMLVGPNGAGKTTTVKVLAGLVRPDGGTTRVDSFVIRPGTNQGAARALIFAAASGFSSAADPVPGDLRFYARLRAASWIALRSVANLAGLRESCTRSRARTFRCGHAATTRSRPFYLPDAPVLLLDEPGSESRSSLAESASGHVAIRGGARIDRSLNNTLGRGMEQRRASMFALPRRNDRARTRSSEFAC